LHAKIAQLGRVNGKLVDVFLNVIVCHGRKGMSFTFYFVGMPLTHGLHWVFVHVDDSRMDFEELL